MAIEESKIKELIEEYEVYRENCEHSPGLVTRGRAGLYRAVIEDLKRILPRKSIADLDVDDYRELTGTVVEYKGGRGVILSGTTEVAMVFTFADMNTHWIWPESVFPQDGQRVWDINGVINSQ